jgi:hypothetical protein
MSDGQDRLKRSGADLDKRFPVTDLVHHGRRQGCGDRQTGGDTVDSTDHHRGIGVAHGVGPFGGSDSPGRGERQLIAFSYQLSASATGWAVSANVGGKELKADG